MFRLPSFPTGIHMLHCRVCLTRTAIAPAAGRSVRSKATLPVDTGSVGVSRPIAHRHHAARCSPITLQRSTIPVSTDSVAPPSSKPTRGNVHSKNPQRSISPASQAALHPLRGATPNQKGCNACGSGAVPTDRVQCPRNNHNCAQLLPTHPIRQSQTQPHSHEMLAPATG